MPIGKDSIQRRVAKNTTTESVAETVEALEAVEAVEAVETTETTAVVQETLPAEPVKKPTTQKKSTTTTKKKPTTTTTTEKKPATRRKPASPKSAPVEIAEPSTTETTATTVIANISPEVVEKVVGHEEGKEPEHIQIGTKMPNYLL